MRNVDVVVVRRSDGIHQIRRRRIPSKLPELHVATLVLLLLAAAMYVAALVSAGIAFAAGVACVAFEVLRARLRGTRVTRRTAAVVHALRRTGTHA